LLQFVLFWGRFGQNTKKIKKNYQKRAKIYGFLQNLSKNAVFFDYFWEFLKKRKKKA